MLRDLQVSKRKIHFVKLSDVLSIKFLTSSGVARFKARWQNCEKRLLASSCLSVRKEQLGSQWTDFDET
jgi:hypothetical protein